MSASVPSGYDIAEDGEDVWVIRFKDPETWLSYFKLWKRSNHPDIVVDMESVTSLLPRDIPLKLDRILDIGQDSGFAVLKSSPLSRSRVFSWIQSQATIHWFQRQEKRRRYRRDSFMDTLKTTEPKLNSQWHFWNATEDGNRVSLGTWDPWSSGITGKGVTVAVVDDGMIYDL